jgi:hypothetical protein
MRAAGLAGHWGGVYNYMGGMYDASGLGCCDAVTFGVLQRNV